MSRNEKKIRAVCAELGIYVESLRWEPIGRAMEMCGREGGWILNDFDPLGLSTEEAIAYLRESPSHFESISEHEEENQENEAVFKNCNVCGRALREKEEFGMGMCLICAAE